MIVGPKGRVLGIDIDNEKLAIAREEASAKGLDNVEFRNADAMHDADEINSFDFTFARQLLCHVPDPAHVLKEMIAYASPGGLVAVDDVDFSGYFCHPPSPAFDRYMSLLRQTVRSRGGNVDIGPELPSLLIAAGVENVEMRVLQLAATQDEMKLIPPISMDSITEAVVFDGLSNASEVKEIADALYAYAEDSETVMSMPRHIQAWGRTPRD
jgi:SAM-dependent methyltransferase